MLFRSGLATGVHLSRFTGHLAATLERARADRASARLDVGVEGLRGRPAAGVHLGLGISGGNPLDLGFHRRSRGLAGFRHMSLLSGVPLAALRFPRLSEQHQGRIG